MEKFIVENKQVMTVKGMEGKLLVSDSHRYKTAKGEISMITPCYASFDMYEIYCIEGDLLQDIERYDTLEEAEERINELLT